MSSQQLLLWEIRSASFWEGSKSTKVWRMRSIFDGLQEGDLVPTAWDTGVDIWDGILSTRPSCLWSAKYHRLAFNTYNRVIKESHKRSGILDSGGRTARMWCENIIANGFWGEDIFVYVLLCFFFFFIGRDLGDQLLQ